MYYILSNIVCTTYCLQLQQWSDFFAFNNILFSIISNWCPGWLNHLNLWTICLFGAALSKCVIHGCCHKMLSFLAHVIVWCQQFGKIDHFWEPQSFVWKGNLTLILSTLLLCSLKPFNQFSEWTEKLIKIDNWLPFGTKNWAASNSYTSYLIVRAPSSLFIGSKPSSV